MKKIKVLPLVLALPLLVSCGQDVKAPKFAKAGDAKEYAAWSEAADNSSKGNVFFPDEADALLPSFKGSRQAEGIIKDEVKRDKKVVYSDMNYSKSQEEYQSDTENGLIRTKEKRSEKEEFKNTYAKQTINSKSAYEHSFQKGTFEDKEYMMDVRVPHKTYILSGQVTETNTYAKLLNTEAESILFMDVMLPLMVIATYPSASEEEQKNYAFYQNGDIFTAEYKKEEKGIETKDAEDKVKWVADTLTSWKVQIDYSNKEAIKTVYYYEEVKTTTYNVSYDMCMPGDVETETRKESAVAELAKKDVKLKAEDLSKYIKA